MLQTFGGNLINFLQVLAVSFKGQSFVYELEKSKNCSATTGSWVAKNAVWTKPRASGRWYAIWDPRVNRNSLISCANYPELDFEHYKNYVLLC